MTVLLASFTAFLMHSVKASCAWRVMGNDGYIIQFLESFMQGGYYAMLR